MLNNPNLTTSLKYLHSILTGRLNVYLGKENSVKISGTAYIEDGSPFALFIFFHKPAFDEYIILLLTLIPHIQPNFYNQIIAECLPDGGDFPCLLYTSDAADEEDSVDLGGRRIIKKKK